MKHNGLLLFIYVLLSITAVPISAQNIDIIGPAGSGNFGNITVLSNGNYVVADQYYDQGATLNVGAVHLYNGSTHTLISTIKGNVAEDRISSGGIIALSNGNFVINSPLCDNGGATNAGAATWVNGTTGLTGNITSANSLVGSRSNDGLLGEVIALPGGNYIVRWGYWDNGSTTDAGAVIWANGTTGKTGAVSSANALVGTTANDNVGALPMVVLPNGHYVVRSYLWDNGSATDAGAFTWCNGNTGITGTVSASNSMVGSKTNDNAGGLVFTVFDNGNYLAFSPYWDNGSITDAGAITWCSGTAPVTGTISSSNSLIGLQAGDLFNPVVTLLTNGNYIISNTEYDNGTVVNAGAVTWCTGGAPLSGTINSSNSLMGASFQDMVGYYVKPLSNGHYVVGSPAWDNGATQEVGAVTWCNGTMPTSGLVSAANSLIGTTYNDRVGYYGIVPLSNGNYVVSSSEWDDGAIVNVGAVTWCNGSGPVTGVVSVANSLIGSHANDFIGGSLLALPNGNYIAGGTNWDNGTIANAGMVTWGNGATGTSGVISAANALVGTAANDGVGPAVVLNNGNYVAYRSSWDNGTIEDAGFAKLCNGATGTFGTIDASNALVGSLPYDNVGYDVYALPSGNYIIKNSYWNAPGAPQAGAMTFANGITGITGTISAANSLIGNNAQDFLGAHGTEILGNGNVVIRSQAFHNGAAYNAGAMTWMSGTTGLTGIAGPANSIVGTKTSDDLGNIGIKRINNDIYLMLHNGWDNGAAVNAGATTLGYADRSLSGYVNSCNSVLATNPNGGFNNSYTYNTVYGYMMMGRINDNIVTIFNPATPAMAVHQDTSFTALSGNRDYEMLTTGGCRIIGKIKPQGPAQVSGSINAKVWVEATLPEVLGQPFVARHYQVTPESNTGSASARITLYFTQQDFDNFNNHPNSTIDLPTGPGDVLGINSLRIGKYPGNSSDGTGLPASYSGTPVIINPADADIVWNASLARWEVSFDVQGFSGFIVQTKNHVLAAPALQFSGRWQNTDALLHWSTSSDNQTAAFDIERSFNGRDFYRIGNNAANAAGRYAYTDINAAAHAVPVLYYRLKQYSSTGSWSYSSVVALSIVKEQQLTLYPNPVESNATLSIATAKAQTIQVRIIDNTGRILQTSRHKVSTGNTSLLLPLSQLHTGIYIIEINGETVRERRTFVKQ